MKKYNTIQGTTEVSDKQIKTMEECKISGTQTYNSGYAHNDLGCDFKNTPEMRAIPLDIILGFLDGFSFNFGSRNLRLGEISDTVLVFKGTVHTD